LIWDLLPSKDAPTPSAVAPLGSLAANLEESLEASKMQQGTILIIVVYGWMDVFMNVWMYDVCKSALQL